MVQIVRPAIRVVKMWTLVTNNLKSLSSRLQGPCGSSPKVPLPSVLSMYLVRANRAPNHAVIDIKSGRMPPSGSIQKVFKLGNQWLLGGLIKELILQNGQGEIRVSDTGLHIY